jgi:hypothetical protein
MPTTCMQPFDHKHERIPRDSRRSGSRHHPCRYMTRMGEQPGNVRDSLGQRDRQRAAGLGRLAHDLYWEKMIRLYIGGTTSVSRPMRLTCGSTSETRRRAAEPSAGAA